MCVDAIGGECCARHVGFVCLLKGSDGEILGFIGSAVGSLWGRCGRLDLFWLAHVDGGGGGGGGGEV